jgi:hypothetical protein
MIWRRRGGLGALGATGAALLAAFVLAPPAEGQGMGQFAVDEEAAQRALERALIQSGSLLLPPRAIEVAPFIGYTRSESQFAGSLVPIEVGDDFEFAISNVRRRRNEVTTGVVVRTGLPWNAQIDLRLPFVYADHGDNVQIGGLTFGSVGGRSVSGIGDVSLTYTQALRREGGGWPGLLASVTWDSDTGRSRGSVATGSGFNEVGFALTATQRQDPLVFTGRLSYQRAFEKDGLRPGDEFGVSAGAFLAVSPETSLQFGLSVTRIGELQANGRAIDGSDRLSASLTLGASTILRRNALLDATLSIGLTDDAPDFAIAVSLPLRFNF